MEQLDNKYYRMGITMYFHVVDCSQEDNLLIIEMCSICNGKAIVCKTNMLMQTFEESLKTEVTKAEYDDFKSYCKNPDLRIMYNCEITRLYPPKNFIPYNCCDGYKECIDIDKCLEDEIKDLWSNGIKTMGCCCGHGKTLGFIQVTNDCIDRMYELGYQNYIYENEFGGKERKDAFIPKTTKHIYHEYRNGFWC